MKSYRLTRNDKTRLQRDPGSLAERLAAEQYDGYGQLHDSGPFDLAKETGAVAEVKSTATSLSDGAGGRFRLWQDQHESLLRQDRDGTGDYIFVLFDVDGRDVTARMLLSKPSRIGRQIGARGGWNRSGHRAGPQHKLPYSAVF